MYLVAQQQNKLTQFPVCASVGVLFSLEILPQASDSTCKPDFLFNNFSFGVLNSQKCYVMFWCIECYLTKTEVSRDPISVAFFDQVALFSDFNHLFDLPRPGLARYSSNAFYILE